MGRGGAHSGRRGARRGGRGARRGAVQLSHSALCCGSYAVYVSEDATRADIRSTFDWPCCCGVESCRCIADFTMEQQAEDPNLWIRDSVLCKACSV